MLTVAYSHCSSTVTKIHTIRTEHSTQSSADVMYTMRANVCCASLLRACYTLGPYNTYMYQSHVHLTDKFKYEKGIHKSLFPRHTQLEVGVKGREHAFTLFFSSSLV